MTDTHTHIYDETFDGDFKDVVLRAEDAGVERFIFPGIDSSVHDRMLRRAGELDGKACICAGLHPTSIDSNWKKELAFVEKQLADGGNIAVGEIGLDTYWSSAYLDEQIEAFKSQMRWAAELSLPAIIHIRNAHDILYNCLDELRTAGTPLRGVFHAFSGSIETYRRLRTYGDFRFGIGGVVTYKNAGIAETVKDIDLTDILLETDSPWLTPVPHRGKRNEPAYIAVIARKIAEIKQCTFDEVAQITNDNTFKLFNIGN